MKGLAVFVLSLFSTLTFAIVGSGNVITENRDVSDFDSISLRMSADVTVTQGDGFSCEIIAEDNLMELIETEVDNGALVLSFKRKANIRSHKSIKIRIEMPEVRRLSVAGSGDIDSNGKITGKQLYIAVDGSGDISLTVDYKDVETHISGSGDVLLKGNTGSHKVSINGSGDVNAFDMNSSSASVTINGSGDVKIAVDNALAVSVNGSGDVYYQGSPESISQSVHGSGDIIKVGKSNLD